MYRLSVKKCCRCSIVCAHAVLKWSIRRVCGRRWIGVGCSVVKSFLLLQEVAIECWRRKKKGAHRLELMMELTYWTGLDWPSKFESSDIRLRLGRDVTNAFTTRSDSDWQCIEQVLSPSATPRKHNTTHPQCLQHPSDLPAAGNLASGAAPSTNSNASPKSQSASKAYTNPTGHSPWFASMKSQPSEDAKS
jgi:hypothetical protein